MRFSARFALSIANLLILLASDSSPVDSTASCEGRPGVFVESMPCAMSHLWSVRRPPITPSCPSGINPIHQTSSSPRILSCYGRDKHERSRRHTRLRPHHRHARRHPPALPRRALALYRPPRPRHDQSRHRPPGQPRRGVLRRLGRSQRIQTRELRPPRPGPHGLSTGASPPPPRRPTPLPYPGRHSHRSLRGQIRRTPRPRRRPRHRKLTRHPPRLLPPRRPLHDPHVGQFK